MYLFLGLIFGISFEMLYLGITYRYLCSCFLKNCLRAKKKDFFAEVSFPIRRTTLSLAFPKEYWKKSTGRIEFINLGLITSQTRSYLWEHSDRPYSSGFIEEKRLPTGLTKHGNVFIPNTWIKLARYTLQSFKAISVVFSHLISQMFNFFGGFLSSHVC